MITCKKFMEELGAYLDDQTAPDVRAELENHLAECPNCWVITDTTKKTIRIYKGMDPYPIPFELHNRLLSALTRVTPKQSVTESGDADSGKS
ncbi:MAG: zf-HC2 domain-containing protein [Bryobacterales bacterium]|nr:zf-HC2 domain-containing protein [Bryobacterales bacterium]